jgi:hypothetical protein
VPQFFLQVGDDHGDKCDDGSYDVVDCLGNGNFLPVPPPPPPPRPAGCTLFALRGVRKTCGFIVVTLWLESSV